MLFSKMRCLNITIKFNITIVFTITLYTNDLPNKMATIRKPTELQIALRDAVEMTTLDMPSLESLAQNGQILGTIHLSRGGRPMYGEFILYRSNGGYMLGRVGGQLAQIAEKNFPDISEKFSELSSLFYMSEYYALKDAKGG